MGKFNFPNKLYNVIYADPPWEFSSKQYQDGNREFKSIETYYNIMSLQDIKALPIKTITDKDCACFLWVTDSHLDKGVEVLNAWGFRYVTIAFVWLKKTHKGKNCVNFAPWTLKSTEICILGMKGNMSKYKASNKVRALVEAERTIHSKKPEEVRKRIIQLFGDIPKIELFARDWAEDWDSWGNELS